MLIYYSYAALHVSGDVFVHHQEHLTVFTASRSIHQCRCRLVSWMIWNSSNSSMTPSGSDIDVYYQLRWSRGSVLAFGTQVRGFAPGRSRRIFRAKKILSTPSFGREVKSSVPCRSFTACKRSLNLTCKSAFRQNYLDISRPQFHLPPLGGLAW